MPSRRLGGLRLADPGITTEPRGLTETQSRLADLFTTTAVPGRSAAVHVVCGILQSRSNPPRQVASDRNFSYYIQQIHDLRGQEPSTTSERSSQTDEHKASCIVHWFG